MSKRVKIELYVSGDLLAKLEMYRAGRKLRTGKHCQYYTAAIELLEAALSEQQTVKGEYFGAA